MEGEAARLVQEVSYRKEASDEQAPLYCNCLTAIRYLFAKTAKVAIPKMWIGSLPKTLVARDWKVLKTDHEHLLAGDLLFLKNNNRLEKITHIAVALSANRFFHCTARVNGCEIIGCEKFHKRYAIVEDEEILLTYSDPREIQQ